TVAGPEELQNIRRLADEQPPRSQERRGKRWPRGIAAVHEPQHLGNPRTFAAFTRHVPVARARRLQRQSHELAATLDRRPVIELISHGATPRTAAAASG